MSEKSVIKRICDICLKEREEERDAVDVPVFLLVEGAGKTRLDMCLQHINRYTSGLKTGRRTKKGEKGTARRRRASRKGYGFSEVQCPYCPERRRGMQGLTSHVRNAHPADYPEFRAQTKAGAFKAQGRMVGTVGTEEPVGQPVSAEEESKLVTA